MICCKGKELAPFRAVIGMKENCEIVSVTERAPLSLRMALAVRETSETIYCMEKGVAFFQEEIDMKASFKMEYDRGREHSSFPMARAAGERFKEIC